MGKQHLSRDDRIFMQGKLQGTRENMDMVAMVLMDKCGWHVQEETADSRDTHSIAYINFNLMHKVFISVSIPPFRKFFFCISGSKIR